MPLQLDNYDVSILKSLLKDGRKSFREISRETGITTPTVKARFTRLVNVGFIRSVSPIFDFDMVEKENILKPALEEEQNKPTEDSSAKDENKKNNNNDNSRINQQQQDSSKIKKGLRIKLDCEFCKGPITSHPHVFRFANYERFFCCTGCMSGYKQKYAGRIESIKRKFAGDE
ncbi:MAG TPA: AsnC family transcriptional regulator [Nitrososphaeraceae archaeon]|nr:AsnC family transcriptional regulator [Nitrososphaeraceae archaeon]